MTERSGPLARDIGDDLRRLRRQCESAGYGSDHGVNNRWWRAAGHLAAAIRELDEIAGRPNPTREG